jgi:hypothetical protein
MASAEATPQFNNANPVLDHHGDHGLARALYQGRCEEPRLRMNTAGRPPDAGQGQRQKHPAEGLQPGGAQERAARRRPGRCPS